MITSAAVEKGIITETQSKSLIREYPRIATLYLLPKRHKNATILPGRPIVSGSDSLCEPILPFTKTLPFYLKDTNDVLRKMEYMQLEDNMLRSEDVPSLLSVHHSLRQRFLYTLTSLSLASLMDTQNSNR